MKQTFLLLVLTWFFSKPSILAQTSSVFADNFNAPIGLDVDSEGNVWLTQTGTGNDDGRVSAITPDGTVHDVITGLPSFFNEETQETVGVWRTHQMPNNRLLVVSGEGIHDLSSTLLTYDLTGFTIGDAALTLNDFEAAYNLLDPILDLGYEKSNAYGVALDSMGNMYVSDAATNTLFRRDITSDELTLFATFDDIVNPTPIGPPMTNTVPTNILSDGANGFYVATLTGFPFVSGSAKVHHVAADGTITDYAVDLTMVVDLAVDPTDGNLVALQFAEFGPMGFMPGSAKVVKIYPRSFGDTVTGVMAEGFGPAAGLAFDAAGRLYVSSIATGEVLKIDFPRPANDNFCDAMPLTVGELCNGSTNGDITNGTLEPNEPTGACFSSTFAVPNSVWYSFVAPPSGHVIVSANFPDLGTIENLQMAIYSSTSSDCTFDSLNQVSCNDAEVVNGGLEILPTIGASLNPGETYYIQISEESFVEPSKGGTFCIQVEEMQVPENDEICNAIAIDLDSEPLVFSNVGATSPPTEFAIAPGPDFSDFFGFNSWGGNLGVTHSVWFTFVAPESGVVDIDLQGRDVIGNFNSKIVIYEANDCESVSADNIVTSQASSSIDNGGGAFTIIFQNRIPELGCLTPGQTYYLMVDGHASVFGSETNDQGRGMIEIKTINPAPLSATSTSFDAGCEGDNNGALLAFGEGGVGGSRAPGFSLLYTYEWSNGETTSVIDSLAAGTYSVTVTDGCGDTVVEEYTIEDIAAPSLVVSDDMAVNAGEATALSAQGTGGRPFDTARAWRTSSSGPFGARIRNIYNFELGSSETNLVGGGDTLAALLSLTYANSVLYGMTSQDFDTNTNDLYEINATTGLVTPLPVLDLPNEEYFIDIEYDLATQTLIGVSDSLGIYQIDPVTGEAALLSHFQLEDEDLISAFNGSAFALKESGKLLLVGNNIDMDVYEITIATGAVNQVGAINLSAHPQNRVAVDPGTNDLYIRHFEEITATYYFYRYDLANNELDPFYREPDTYEGGVIGFAIAPRTEDAYMYAWSPAEGLDDASSASPTATVDETTTYSVTVTDGCGAETTEAVTLTVGGAEEGADLELSIASSLSEYTIYEVVPYTITLTNNGPEPATNVKVAAGLPQGMVHTSNNAMTGTYNLFFEEWTIPFLLSGETATLELVLFPLVSGTDLTNFVQVLSSDQSDPDSTPGNDTDNIADEDDESALTLSSASNFAETIANVTGLVGTAQLYPSPAIEMVNISWISADETATTIRLFNSLGELVQRQNVKMVAGFNQFELEVNDLVEGTYFVVIGESGTALNFTKM